MNLKMTARFAVASGLLLALWYPASFAQEAPDELNYQGVLRDASNAPLDGAFDMTFRFFDAATAGNELLVDRHTASDSAPVAVTGGLFNVTLGTGVVSDGTGPGTYSSLADVFASNSQVWLRIEVDGELLDPRIKVSSAAFSLNAGRLGGHDADGFLRSDAVDTFSGGELRFADGSGLLVEGDPANLSIGGTNLDLDVGGSFRADRVRSGGSIRVNDGGSVFVDYGIEFPTSGAVESLVFDHSESLFDFSQSLELGSPTRDSADLRFEVAGPDGRIWFDGLEQEFGLTDDLRIGSGLPGEDATLTFFLGSGAFQTVSVAGASQKFDFSNTVNARDLESRGNIRVNADGPDGFSSIYFYEDGHDTGEALTWNNGEDVFTFSDALRAEQLESGGNIHIRVDGPDGNGSLWFWNNDVALGERLYWNDSSDRLQVSDDFFVEGGFQASGTKNFVQNHPRDEALSIVYTALEGDEPATFTRGTARLDNGVARVQLGETFAWVTNPDVGLTAHLTPRGPATVWVESLTPHELVVRADAESTDVRFDYVVLGLRLGYEEHSVLVERTTPAPLPSRESFERYYAAHPERRAGAPLARHVAMLEAVGENAPETLAADELVRMAGTFEPDLPSPVVHSPEGVRRANIPGGVPDARIGSGRPTDEHRVAKERRASLALDSRVIEDDTLWLPVSSPVEQGDVLALSATESDLFAPASSIADAGVVGIAAGRSRVDDDGRLVAPMAGSVYAVVKADAGFGAIWPGDLLVSSPTPGHAMRAVEVSVGTVIGKAIDRLETGTGTIRVLVTAR